MAKKPHKPIREVWKPIPGYKGYEASTRGRIRSIDRWSTKYAKWRIDGTRSKHRFFLHGKTLRPGHARGGFHVTLSLGGSIQRQVSIHKLIMRTFVGPCPKGKEVCHNDGKYGHNELINLRYDTKKNNLKDRWRHGTMNAGRMNGSTKLTARQVRQIRKRSDGLRAICRDYGISETTAWSIRTRHSWTWLK